MQVTLTFKLPSSKTHKVVGKSSILFRYINNCWEENLPPTIGGSFMVKVKEYKGMKLKY